MFLPRTRLLKKFGGFFQLAKKLAESSKYGSFRHGAVLARGGSIVSLGVNSDKYCSIGKDHRSEDRGNPTYHAEIRAVLNIPRHITKGAVMYVARCSKDGIEDRMSNPCSMCHAVMEERGIHKVYYTVDNEVVGTYKF
jgi:tRNA(Arg) A34 adenosine deaminase TadA